MGPVHFFLYIKPRVHRSVEGEVTASYDESYDSNSGLYDPMAHVRYPFRAFLHPSVTRLTEQRFGNKLICQCTFWTFSHACQYSEMLTGGVALLSDLTDGQMGKGRRLMLSWPPWLETAQGDGVAAELGVKGTGFSSRLLCDLRHRISS